MLPQIKPASLQKFHAKLAEWYRVHGRHDLPWRNTNDPYAIWVSEIMLQQTQVATVRDRFYAPFLKKFPTVQALAAAPGAAAMKAWEGLGYYRRARNLHKAAKAVVHSEWWVVSRENAPPLTTHYTQLTALPGIGKNTAHAILAFGYNAPVAILEANVKRIVARVFALEHPSEAELWAGAEALLPKSPPTTHYSPLTIFHYNQAMMDVGALACTPKAPNCKVCPAQTMCKGKHAPEHYPQKKAKKKTPVREVRIVVCQDAKGRFLLEARDATLLGGTYGFVQICMDEPLPRGAKKIGAVKHVYSHFKLVGEVVLVPAQNLPPPLRGRAGVGGATKDANSSTSPPPNLPPQGEEEEKNPKFYTAAQIKKLPLSTLDHKVFALVSHHCGAK